MFPNNQTQSNERQIFTSLIVQYRRPCFYQYVDPEMCKKFVTDLVALYEIAWESAGVRLVDEMNEQQQDLISDIRHEINNACKRANIEFEWLHRALYNKGCVEKWEAMTASRFS